METAGLLFNILDLGIEIWVFWMLVFRYETGDINSKYLTFNSV